MERVQPLIIPCSNADSIGMEYPMRYLVAEAASILGVPNDIGSNECGAILSKW